MNYKKTLALFILLALISPTFISAKNEDAGSKQGKGFCERISSLQGNINKRMGGNIQKLSQKRAQMNNRLSEKREEHQEQREQRREKWDLNRSEHFNLLKEKAGTEEQKQMVATFVESVQSAISIRRGAIDLAVSDFKTALDGLKESRKASANSLVQNYKDELQIIFTVAESDCKNGSSDPRDINEVLRTELKSLKDSFVESGKGLGNDREAIQSLISIKKEAVQKAVDTFKESVQTSLSELKAVLGE